MSILRAVVLTATSCVCFINQSAVAEEQPAGLSIKPVGVGLEYLEQKQAFSVTGFTVDNPVLAALLPADARERVSVKSKLVSTGVKADYWVKPYLNVFGSVAKVDTTAVVNLSALGLGLPDISVNADGNLYNAGATLAVGKLPYFGTLTYIHSVADMNGVSKDGKADTFIANAV